MKRDFLFRLLIFVVSFLLPLSGAYSCYDVIVEADFLTTGVKFEAADRDNLLLNKQNLMGMIPTPSSSLLILGDNFFEPFPDSSPSIPAPHQISSLLRC
jgi:hypothetical protein